MIPFFIELGLCESPGTETHFPGFIVHNQQTISTQNDTLIALKHPSAFTARDDFFGSRFDKLNREPQMGPAAQKIQFVKSTRRILRR